MITTDMDGRITFLNPAAETMTGWSAPEASGQPVGNVFRIVNEMSREPLVSPAEGRKSAILDASLDVIVTMDHAGRVADFNRK